MKTDYDEQMKTILNKQLTDIISVFGRDPNAIATGIIPSLSHLIADALKILCQPATVWVASYPYEGVAFITKDKATMDAKLASDEWKDFVDDEGNHLLCIKEQKVIQ